MLLHIQLCEPPQAPALYPEGVQALHVLALPPHDAFVAHTGFVFVQLAFVHQFEPLHDQVADPQHDPGLYHAAVPVVQVFGVVVEQTPLTGGTTAVIGAVADILQTTVLYQAP